MVFSRCCQQSEPETFLVKAGLGRIWHTRLLAHASACREKLSYLFGYFQPGHERAIREKSILFVFSKVIRTAVQFVPVSCKSDNNSGDRPVAGPMQLRWPIPILPIEVTNCDWTKAVYLQIVNAEDLSNFERRQGSDVDCPAWIRRATHHPRRGMVKVTMDLDCANDDSQQYGRKTDR